MTEPRSAIGRSVDRYDGRAKVTGQARYAADNTLPDLAYAVVVQSTAAGGAVTHIDTAAAESSPGVLAVLTHANADRMFDIPKDLFTGEVPGDEVAPLQSGRIRHDGQHVAVVVADTLERAVHGAELVAVSHIPDEPSSELGAVPPFPAPDSFYFGSRLNAVDGDPATALAAAPIRLDLEYRTPIEHHNPMEPHGVVAAWDGDDLTLFDTTQHVIGSRNVVARRLGIARECVRIVSPFVGGGFGAKTFPWSHVALAALAARRVGRPVKLVLTRKQLFTSTGHRPATVQRLAVGADRDGALVALRHHVTTHTSLTDSYCEPAALVTRYLYACPNIAISHDIARLNLPAPLPMRGPGEAPGVFALESALDELAHRAGVDPVALRHRNHADVHPVSGKPFSCKRLRECYDLGAELIGWNERSPVPGTMADGNFLVGYGMATATYPANTAPCSARISLTADGEVAVASAVHDIGTGTATIMAQLVAELLGVRPEAVTVVLGDSDLPEGAMASGSKTTASVGAAIEAAVARLRAEVVRVLTASGGSPADLAEQRIPLGDIVRLSGRRKIAVEGRSELLTGTIADNLGVGGPVELNSFGAQYCKVRVDRDLGEVRVTDFVSVHDVGRVVNPKLATNQVYGGVVFGLGMALTEETILDERSGRFVTRDLATYHVPTNPDVPSITVRFIDEPDLSANSFGVKGVGEISAIGVPAAIANAVFHATGVRFRELPITPDRVLARLRDARPGPGADRS
ncbi:xanthine dehydrogenase family protein molybdopterin-binding subunit [Dactylosporangium sucinum]|uniref:Acylaldehyde oxidase n=1 Tax=Dactylosporangium sucinum TaxID=1424081 RepID=A0A917U7Z0_9ACTN|nr:xanthine dehydrogenase family protein molybdopterin-binding subunit [Dactylosporangium sucinum]GGM64731.1 acylaldehyde oxidase [Dactylosporangium sucinum]